MRVMKNVDEAEEMSMLKTLRRAVVQALWESALQTSTQLAQVVNALKDKGITSLPIDHFAVIDLPGPKTGIPQLHELFSTMGYIYQGNDYLPDKQNDFMWLTEEDSHLLNAADVLPQVVVADFRLEMLPPEIQKIIEYYAYQASPSPVPIVRILVNHLQSNKHMVFEPLKKILTTYFMGRDWPLPTVREFECVREFNELLAWVLVFGRKPNHFTIATHLLNTFKNLTAFNTFITEDLKLALNNEAGTIKGDAVSGIVQSSTMGIIQEVKLADGIVRIPTDFVEFVWRFPHSANINDAQKWQDFFTGFVAQNANHVIESLLVSD